MTEAPEIVLTPAEAVAACQLAAVLWEASLCETARLRSGQGGTLDIRSLSKPGTIVWTDPFSGEERYSRPGDRAYSTALFHATAIIGEDGRAQPWPDGAP